MSRTTAASCRRPWRHCSASSGAGPPHRLRDRRRQPPHRAGRPDARGSQRTPGPRSRCCGFRSCSSWSRSRSRLAPLRAQRRDLPGGASPRLRLRRRWLVATVGFGLYVANFANYSNTYGALGGGCMRVAVPHRVVCSWRPRLHGAPREGSRAAQDRRARREVRSKAGSGRRSRPGAADPGPTPTPLPTPPRQPGPADTARRVLRAGPLVAPGARRRRGPLQGVGRTDPAARRRAGRRRSRDFHHVLARDDHPRRSAAGGSARRETRLATKIEQLRSLGRGAARRHRPVTATGARLREPSDAPPPGPAAAAVAAVRRPATTAAAPVAVDPATLTPPPDPNFD